MATEVVEEDEAALLRASQLAGLGRERGKARLAAMGQTVTVRKGDDSDMTVQVRRSCEILRDFHRLRIDFKGLLIDLKRF